MMLTMESAYGSVNAANISSVFAFRSACSLRACAASPTRTSRSPTGAASALSPSSPPSVSESPCPPRNFEATSIGSFVGSATYAPVASPSRIVVMCDFALSAVAARFKSGRSEASLFTPTSAPPRLNTGPPESPGLSGASIASRQPSRPMTRPTRSGGGRQGERSGPSGCPNATTRSPVANDADAPSSTNGSTRPALAIFKSPTSPSGPKCWPAVTPVNSVPSARNTLALRPGC